LRGADHLGLEASQTSLHSRNCWWDHELDWQRRKMLGDLIAALERPEVVAAVLSSLHPELAAKVAERAAQASMSVGDFSAGAVRAFLDEADDDLWFQLLTLIRKSEDPGLSAVQTILRWVVTA
jgi:hypothetical protein